jgi:hypothetical protein
MNEQQFERLLSSLDRTKWTEVISTFIVVFSFVLAVISLWYAKTQLVFAKGQLDEARHLMKADHVRSQRKLAMDMCSNWSNFTSPETASVTRLIEKMTPGQCGALANLDKLSIDIGHIRFPHYKNLAPDTKIDFTFPITALVGANGTNKSSILRALQGAPGMNNLGVFWFSTSVDPIQETGSERSAFIYGYHHASAKKLVEVLKTRVRKLADSDYWEPSRRIAKYGMDDFPRRAAR